MRTEPEKAQEKNKTMANIKDIAATLAILGSGALLVGCGKDKPATEVPAGDEAAGGEEKSCGAEGEKSCGEGEKSCSAEGAAEGEEAAGEEKPAEGSCGGK